MLKAYLITLNTTFRAKESIEQLLEKIPNLEIYYGFDARKLELSQMCEIFSIEKFLNLYKRLPNSGEIGCALSHRQCIERAFADPAVSCCLVLEDDAVITGNADIIDKLRYAALQEELDIVVLGSTKNSANPFAQKSNPLFEIEKIDGISLGYRYSNGVPGAVGYMMTRRAFNKIKETKLPYNLADDWIYYKKFDRLKVSFVQPPIVVENEALPSTLGHDVGIQKNRYIRYKILWPIYQVLWRSRSLSLRFKYGNYSKKKNFL